MRIASNNFLPVFSLLALVASGSIWFLILSQAIGFLVGIIFMIVFSFFIIRWGFLVFRSAGELLGLKKRKQIMAVSLIAALALVEIFWTLSFLPFSFFILGGIFSITFVIVFNILKEYFKRQQENALVSLKEIGFYRFLKKNITIAVILIIILISISPWLPPKAF